tara:strand:+ start:3296 stop:6595 length:3300 start_codon:yes stop_codon:yes gene_type:complete
MDKKVRLQITDVIDSVNANPQLIDVTLGNSTGTTVSWFPPFYWSWYSIPLTQYSAIWPGVYDISSRNVPSNRCMPGLCNSTHYLDDILSSPLILGETYILSFTTINMKAGVGYTGALGIGATSGVSANARLTADGYYSETFVATGTTLRMVSSKSKQFAAAGWTHSGAIICNISCIQVSFNKNNNIIGDIELTDSENFPLSLSYAVSDGENLENRFGDYSKTFEIPATKNNNKLLSHIFNVKSVNTKDITGLKNCRVLVGDTEFFRGRIKINGTSQTSTPNSYSATIYGGNYGWISKLKGLNLNDEGIYNDTETFTYDYLSIMQSFDDTQANSEVVFPLISYGDCWPNPGAGFNYAAGKVNLSDETDNSQDWRPSFWIYNILQRIFSNIGYTINSNFIENSEFKKLICHFSPDNSSTDTEGVTSTEGATFATRAYWNKETPTGGTKGIWDSSLVGLVDYQIVESANWVSGTLSGVTQGNIDGNGEPEWKDVIMDEEISSASGATNTAYDETTGVWTCPKSGLYNFSTAVDILIGNFDNSQASNGVIVDDYSSSGGFHRHEVGIRIVMKDSSGGSTGLGAFDNFGTSQTELTLRTQIGKIALPTLGDGGNYEGQDVPIFIPVHKEMQTPYAWYVPAGYTVRVQVAVQFNFYTNNSGLNSNATAARMGYIVLSDEHRKACSGGAPGIFPYNRSANNYGDSYYTDGSKGFLNNNAGLAGDSSLDITNANKTWARNAKPFFKVEPVPNQGFMAPEVYKIKQCLPTNVSQIDFIKSLSHLFNLQFSTNTDSKTVNIEPFDDFYLDKSNAYDWSSKVDYSKEIKDVFNIAIYEEMSWEYKKDSSDGLMSFVNEAFRPADSSEHFFNVKYNMGVEFNKGMKRFVNPVFASTWTDWNADAGPGSNPKLMPVINKSESVYGYAVAPNPTRPDKITKYSPRIMKYNGMVKGPNDPSNAPSGQTGFQTVWGYYGAAFSGQTDTYHGSSSSPRAMFVDWEDTTYDLFSNLSFADEIINPPYSTEAIINKGLYSLFWEGMIEKYKANPRTRTYYINLQLSDIINIDLRKLVYIDGSYWKINKIVDYSPAKNDLTKVELIQWTEEVSSALISS